MAESGGDDSDDGLIVASVPEEQGRLMCIQYPGIKLPLLQITIL